MVLRDFVRSPLFLLLLHVSWKAVIEGLQYFAFVLKCYIIIYFLNNFLQTYTVPIHPVMGQLQVNRPSFKTSTGQNVSGAICPDTVKNVNFTFNSYTFFPQNSEE